VTFASVQEKLDFTTPWGKLMLTVLGMLAEIYLDNVRRFAACADCA
jgi:DNA invertase Pin-like site-specific DNA recombinase